MMEDERRDGDPKKRRVDGGDVDSRSDVRVLGARARKEEVRDARVREQSQNEVRR